MEERFWSKVNKTDTCWLWIAGRTRGYGKFRFDGKQSLAHRVSWLLAGNTIPNGLVLCHAAHDVCGNKHCVNPAHLRIDTQAVNVYDKITDGTIARKLTEDKVRAIRANVGNKTHEELARQYTVSRPLISLIIARKSWNWLH